MLFGQTFLLSPKSLNNAYWFAVENGMKDAAKVLGVKAIFDAPIEADAAEQAQKINSYISSGVNGIAISPNDPAGIKVVVRNALNKGIPVITFDSDAPDSGRYVYLGTNNYNAGYEAGKLMGETILSERPGQKIINLAILTGGLAALNTNERIAGFKDALAEFEKETGIKVNYVVDHFPTEDGVARVVQIVRDVERTYPNLDGWFTASNIFDVLLNSSFIAIMACGMTMVIITTGINLSVGSVMGFVGMFMAIMMVDYSLPPLLAVLLGLGIGTLFGFVNGLLVTKVKLPPFITTLGMMSVGRGLAYITSGGWPVSGFPENFMISGQGHFIGIPLPVIYLLIIAVISHIFLRYTVLGKHIYAVGGNEKAAKLVGIKAEKVILITYVINGLLAAMSGFLMTSWLGMAQPNAGQGYELDVIAATVIGGTSLSGGEGSILGAVLGAWIMATLRNGMILLRVSSFWQELVIGAVIVIAVALDRMRNRSEEE